MSDQVKIHFLAQKSDGRPRTQMMAFLIVTGNGKAIAVDGGNKQDTEYFHGYIEALLGPKPHIDLWFLTHPHDDHTDVLYEMLRRFPDDFTVGRLIYSFPPFDFLDRYEKDCAHTVSELDELLPVLRAKGTDVRAAQKGDLYAVDGVTFEILRTYDTSITPNADNNASMVFRMEACGQSVLFTGDLGVEGGEQVLRTVMPEKIRSDFVQMAHHGQNGVGRGFYEAAAPKACLWSTPDWLWNNDAGGGYNTHSWKTVEVRGWMEELGVRHHFVNKDGTQVIILPYGF
jgi:beta-lactamase superfamily II metal-dependent hydrolase